MRASPWARRRRLIAAVVLGWALLVGLLLLVAGGDHEVPFLYQAF